MNVTQEEVVDRQAVLLVELDDDDVAPYLDQAYRRVVQKTAIPGFRKGKAPRSIIESFLGKERLVSESLDNMLPAVTQKAIENQELETSGTPRLELLDLDPVTVKATVPLKPLVDLGSYLDIRVDEEVIDITDDLIDERLEDLRVRDAAWEPVERPVNYGDRVIMQVVGHVGDDTILDSEDAEYLVDKEGNLPFEGFSENLVEAECGTPVEFHLAIPDDYADARMAGKDVHFRVIVKEIKERKLPELNDEFAKGIGDGFETLADLRKNTESDLRTEAERASETKYRENALDELVAGANFEFPPLLIEHEIEHMVERRDQFAAQMNFTLEEYFKFTGKSQEEHQEEMRGHAIERFSRSYALSTLSENEELVISDEEIQEKVQQLRDTETQDGGKVKESDLTRPEVQASIRESLLVEKAMERLLEITKDQMDSKIDNESEVPGDEPEKLEEESDDS